VTSPGCVEGIGRAFGVEGDLEIFITGLSDGDMRGIQLHGLAQPHTKMGRQSRTRDSQVIVAQHRSKGTIERSCSEALVCMVADDVASPFEIVT
jgi:hypothetical protein